MLFKNKKSVPVIPMIEHKALFKRYLMLIFGCFIMSVAFNTCFLKQNIVYGGVSGISIITNSLLGWTPSVVILVLSQPREM